MIPYEYIYTLVVSRKKKSLQWNTIKLLLHTIRMYIYFDGINEWFSEILFSYSLMSLGYIYTLVVSSKYTLVVSMKKKSLQWKTTKLLFDTIRVYLYSGGIKEWSSEKTTNLLLDTIRVYIYSGGIKNNSVKARVYSIKYWIQNVL